MSINVLKKYKNYLKFVEKSATIHSSGLTYSVDSDGIITMNGTTSGTSSNAYSPFSYYLTLPAGDYTFTSLNQNDAINTEQLYLTFQDGSGETRGTGSLNRKGTTTFTLTQTTTLRVYFFFYGGNTYNNTKLYPMIIEGTYTYETVPGFIKNVSRLPSEYQEVEYIESDGNQYINSNISCDQNSKVEVEFSSSATACGVLGSQANAIGLTLNFSNDSSTRWGTYALFGYTSCLDGDRHIIEFSRDGLYDNKTLAWTPTQNTFTTGDIWVGKINGAGTSNQKKIYYAKIWNNNTLVRDFIPCYRKSDNVIGLYDLVNNQFYTNAGTGTFIIGEIVVYDGFEVQKKEIVLFSHNLPSAYQEVEYIESTGTQYIDTGIVADNSTGVKLEASFSDVTSDMVRFGSRTTTGDTRFTIGTINGYIYFGWGTTISNNTYTISTNTKYSIKLNYLNNRKAQYGNYGEIDITSDLPTQTYNTLIFAHNRVGTITYSTYKLYGCEITSGQNVVRKFIPCYRILDGVIGLYDLVNNQFYTNAGTGTFTKGNDSYSTNKYKMVFLKKTDNLLKLTRTEWNSVSYQPTDLVTFDYNKLYYMAGSGYIRPKENSLNETITNNSVTFTATNSSWWGIGFPIEVKPNTKYTISLKRTDGNKTKPIYTIYNADGTFSRYSQVSTNVSLLDITNTITTGATETTLIIVIAGITQGDTVYAYDIQVEEGQTATAFKPYGYITTKI